MGEKTAQALWQDYRFLTKEMVKFITKQDMELFYKLLEQRGKLQPQIERAPDDGFKDSSAGQDMLNEVQQDNKFIIECLQSRRNRIKKHRQVMDVYNVTGSVHSNRTNWER
ncbi:hypothetical protein REC12_21840 [Desulfosporosinus sp. PR]|uniref:hypothetical protein n=1 Tax=Candidatus Desulfosporosinus nitrosoreducens TaxID=3401928 RepID=UPI0027FDB714|nr:hypothetical protein [Desulfosporosinus sp. PR]MDQ7096243.1 hypothetical protein [Desulfosporosinus sp. PR]